MTQSSTKEVKVSVDKNNESVNIISKFQGEEDLPTKMSVREIAKKFEAHSDIAQPTIIIREDVESLAVAKIVTQTRAIFQARSTVAFTHQLMPFTYLVKPYPAKGKLDVEGMFPFSRAKNFLCRKWDSMVMDTLWERCRLTFFCPILLEEVPCGPDGHGYDLKLPTKTLKTLIPALKMGLLFLRVALASQGLGGVVPNIPFTDVTKNIPITNDYINGVAMSLADLCKTSSESYLTDKINGSINNLAADLDKYKEQQQIDQKNERKTYEHLCSRLQKIENIDDNNMCLDMTGLEYRKDNAGDKSNVWISDIALKDFEEVGFDRASELFLDKNHRQRRKHDFEVKKKATSDEKSPKKHNIIGQTLLSLKKFVS